MKCFIYIYITNHDYILLVLKGFRLYYSNLGDNADDLWAELFSRVQASSVNELKEDGLKAFMLQKDDKEQIDAVISTICMADNPPIISLANPAEADVKSIRIETGNVV